MKIVFRVDASAEIGTGHVMRCLTLADMLKKEGAQCLFICRTHAGNLIERIRQKGFSVETLPPQNVQEGDLHHSLWLGASQEADAEACARLLADNPTDWLIVDHYALDEHWEKTMRPCCKRLMVMDDLADRRHDCDLLLDQNLVAGKDQRYQDKVPQQCGLLLGPKYALLQPQYAKLHDRTPPREGMIQRILIYFGGSDRHNLTGMSVEAFLALERKDISLDIVMSMNSPHAKKIKKQVARHEYITLHESLPSLAPLMLKADLAIGAAGATSWERCCMGLPAIVITLAENQIPAAAELNRLGMISWLGHSDKISKEILLTALKERITQEAMASVSETCQSLVDGRGTERVSAFLTLNEKTPFVARLAKLKDENLLHKWVNDPWVRENSFHSNIIDAHTHRRWFRARLRDSENCRIYIIETEQGLPVGQARFERKGREWEMGYSLDMRLRARGIGRTILKTALLALRMDIEKSIVLGRVKENNVRGVKLLESLGFKMTNHVGREIIYRNLF
jgi:UDP-2,4-diacetamido-2,4,6-trideoxy-beta-L-altropyranose hydrolase